MVLIEKDCKEIISLLLMIVEFKQKYVQIIKSFVINYAFECGSSGVLLFQIIKSFEMICSGNMF